MTLVSDVIFILITQICLNVLIIQYYKDHNFFYLSNKKYLLSEKSGKWGIQKEIVKTLETSQGVKKNYLMPFSNIFYMWNRKNSEGRSSKQM